MQQVCSVQISLLALLLEVLQLLQHVHWTSQKPEGKSRFLSVLKASCSIFGFQSPHFFRRVCFEFVGSWFLSSHIELKFTVSSIVPNPANITYIIKIFKASRWVVGLWDLRWQGVMNHFRKAKKIFYMGFYGSYNPLSLWVSMAWRHDHVLNSCSLDSYFRKAQKIFCMGFYVSCNPLSISVSMAHTTLYLYGFLWLDVMTMS